MTFQPLSGTPGLPKASVFCNLRKHTPVRGTQWKGVLSGPGGGSSFSLETGTLGRMLAHLLNWIVCINCKTGWTSDREINTVPPAKKNQNT